ncbi:uncharacterized protein LOC115456143 [Manduca sexta]|uniref:uncharacterized protein LOC115456143 n=1 Tax=Manduca sexta TaxID=7130 RepID=UPI0011839A6E|nr:uncharacterized protein LOC115456143 [Manduca sexta]
MDLLNDNEIALIAKQCGCSEVKSWHLEDFSDKIVGYLADHLKLTIEVELKGETKQLKYFVKCMPRFDKLKAQYLKELKFFKKEYVMLSSLFKEFGNSEGSRQWRPKSLLVKEEVFILQDVGEIGYVMPHHQSILSLDVLKASVEALARFHAQSITYEEIKSRELGRPYRIWEDYSDYLQEPESGIDWRDTGRNAVIDFLKVHSKFKGEPNFNRHLELVIPMLFDGAMALMKPNTEYRNVVVHRDLWTNNLFVKQQNNSCHVLIIDFQTVLYCAPMLDLCALIFFNTTRAGRKLYTNDMIEVYYNALANELLHANIDIADITDKDALVKSYRESVMFGITQAALIVPIIAMSSKKREEIYCNPETGMKANVVSRSEHFLGFARENTDYRNRLLDLLDEIVERYMYPNESKQNYKEKY